MEDKNSEKDLICKVNEQVEKSIEEIIDSGVTPTNLDNLGKLVDIHKDLKNEEYWKAKEENFMRYGNYGRDSYGEYGEDSYGRRSRDSRGRYMDSYGRRGVKGTGRGRYRGEELMDEMYDAYNDYMDSNEYGNYGTSENMQKIEIMADSLMDFIHHIKKEAKTPEEKQLIDEKLKEIGRM
ncbi:hypothetical protein [uncultured Rikenella sp.]|uniref:hypothetical protein n=1 Tax=uncultured Rikenella sp. TaxID=368003 RepID=UPI00261F07B7|nr:hypothetical protein [uncultured Rikenella sp.]